MSTDNLSPEEKEVNKIINESKTKVEALERQISELPRDQGPAPRNNLPGGPPPLAPGRNAEIKKEALAAIEKEKNELTEMVDKTLANSSQEIKERGQKNLTNYLYGDKPKEGEGKEQKDINPSQEFAMKLRFGNKGKEPVIPDHERAREKDLSASQEFASKLRFNETQKGDKDMTGKESEGKQNKFEGMSMSAQFNQKLKYTQMEEKSDKDTSKDGLSVKQPQTNKEPEKG